MKTANNFLFICLQDLGLSWAVTAGTFYDASLAQAHANLPSLPTGTQFNAASFPPKHVTRKARLCLATAVSCT